MATQIGHTGQNVVLRVEGVYEPGIEIVPPRCLLTEAKIAQNLGLRLRRCIVLVSAVQVSILQDQIIFSVFLKHGLMAEVSLTNTQAFEGAIVWLQSGYSRITILQRYVNLCTKHRPLAEICVSRKVNFL